MDNNPNTEPQPYQPQHQQPFPPYSPQAMQPQPYQQPVVTDPGRTLGIVGFILAFLANFIGVIVSIVALAKSKKAGFSNGLAVAGIIIGSISFVVNAIIVGYIASLTMSAIEACSSTADLGRDITQQCIEDHIQSRDNRSNSAAPAKSAKDVTDTTVTVEGTRVTSACFSFDLPKEYKLDTNSKDCMATIYPSYGKDAMLAIRVMPETNAFYTPEEFRKSAQSTDGATVKLAESRRLANGVTATYAEVSMAANNNLLYGMHFVPVDQQNSFKVYSQSAKSFQIFGYAEDSNSGAMHTIANSFAVN